MRRVAVLLLALPFLVLFPAVVLAGVTSGVGSIGLRGASLIPLPASPRAGSAPPSGQTQAAMPPDMLALYHSAARSCPGLPWSVLAGIGTVESSNGTSTLPGVHAGANFAGAEGPMQFEPATFASYAYPVPPGGANPPSPYDPADAVYAAARDLCANGGGTAAGLANAVFAYNHAKWYVNEVLGLAGVYQAGSSPTPGWAR